VDAGAVAGRILPVALCGGRGSSGGGGAPAGAVSGGGRWGGVGGGVGCTGHTLPLSSSACP